MGRSRRASSEPTTSRRSPRFRSSYDTAHEILKVLAGPNVPSGWQGGLAPGLSRRSRPGRSPPHRRDGLQDPSNLERDRHDSRHGRARPLGHGRQPSRRLGLRRGRPGQRHRRHARDVPRPGRGGEARLEAPAYPRLRELGCRGVRPGRLDRVGRGARQGDRRRRPC